MNNLVQDKAYAAAISEEVKISRFAHHSAAVMKEAPWSKIIFVQWPQVNQVSRGMFSCATHTGTILGIPTSEFSLSQSPEMSCGTSVLLSSCGTFQECVFRVFFHHLNVCSCVWWNWRWCMESDVHGCQCVSCYRETWCLQQPSTDYCIQPFNFCSSVQLQAQ